MIISCSTCIQHRHIKELLSMTLRLASIKSTSLSIDHAVQDLVCIYMYYIAVYVRRRSQTGFNHA